MEHYLKELPEYYKAVVSGDKTFEVRKNDRYYKVGDFLILQEFADEKYTGYSCRCSVTYILNNAEYCKDGYVILGIKYLNDVTLPDENGNPRPALIGDMPLDKFLSLLESSIKYH